VNEILFGSAAGAAQLVRRKEVSARELTEALLARIEAVDPAVNAVVELRREAALQEASARTRRLAGVFAEAGSSRLFRTAGRKKSSPSKRSPSSGIRISSSSARHAAPD
jgi:hypothetical protein